MKYNTCLVVWHNKEPVYSIDFHPGSDRFATAGADKTVKIWKWNGDGSFVVEFVATLQRHNAAVNIVRFSPNGETLASGGDDGMVFLWKLNPTPAASPAPVGLSEEDESLLNKETWSIANTLICGKEIYSLDWSPDSTAIITGSIDTTVTVWNLVGSGGPRRVQEIRDHTHYVQGVGWDPRNKFLLTQSIDRTVRVYRMQRKARKGASSVAASYVCGAILKKRTGEGFAARKEKKATSKQEEPLTDASSAPDANDLRNVVAASSAQSQSVPMPEEPFVHKMFLDESVNSFFRRICWSPCGNFFFAPTGTFMKNSQADPVDCTYVFSRDNMRAPICYIPCPSKPSIIIRCNPALFQLRAIESSASLLDLKYRIVFAIATIDSVLVYDSQHTAPLMVLKDIHYASISDLSWSLDGYRLGISSTDGFCSFVQFDRDDLGLLLEGPDLEDAMLKVTEARLGLLSSKPGEGTDEGNSSFDVVNKSADDIDDHDVDGTMNDVDEHNRERSAKRKELDELFVMPPAKMAKASESAAMELPPGNDSEPLSAFDPNPTSVLPTAPRPKAKRVTPQILSHPSQPT